MKKSKIEKIIRASCLCKNTESAIWECVQSKKQTKELLGDCVRELAEKLIKVKVRDAYNVL